MNNGIRVRMIDLIIKTSERQLDTSDLQELFSATDIELIEILESNINI